MDEKYTIKCIDHDVDVDDQDEVTRRFAGDLVMFKYSHRTGLGWAGHGRPQMRYE